MKISITQQKLITKLGQKKYRQELKQCIVSGEKNVATAKENVVFSFTSKDVKDFKKIVGTNEPQDIAAVVTTPQWQIEDLKKCKVIVVADGIQDPGNIGTLIRLCAGFDAGLILIESADPTNVKTIRSSAGLFFQVPWLEISRSEAKEIITSLKRQVLKLENKNTTLYCHQHDKIKKLDNKLILIAGSEGQGIKLNIDAQSLSVKTNTNVESLNVATACAIALHALHNR